jgi:hypothetical protein
MIKPHARTLRFSYVIAIACLLAPVIVAGQAQAPARSKTEGLKETEKFIKAGQETTESVAAAKQHVQDTLTAYNTLVTQPSKDIKGDYKKLLKQMESMNKSVSDAKEKLTPIQSTGDTYFSGRAESIKGIQDPQLQSTAQQRLQKNKEQFSGVLASLHEAGQSLEPFRKDLADQITFLGSDLNPSGLASVKPKAGKLNAEGSTIFTKTDQAIAKANEYFTGLKAES